ncbi:MAG: PorT family protein [Bacteroidales bacterium]|jgi:hypothetical protein|nr:PorT family protein [Bacteroidales bacterium]
MKNKHQIMVINKHYFALIISCLCIFGMNTLSAQIFKGELIAGANLTQVDGDRVIGFKKVGVHAGAGVMWNFNFKRNSETKPFGLSMEILYNQRGAREKNADQYKKDTSLSLYGVKFRYHLFTDYVSVPIMFSYTYLNRFSIGVGLSYSRLVRLKEIEVDVERTNYTDTVPTIAKNGLEFLLDIRVRIWQQLKIGFRYEYSIPAIRERYFPQINGYWATLTGNQSDEKRQQRHNSLCLYLVYMFNEKKDNSKIERKKPEDRRYYY